MTLWCLTSWLHAREHAHAGIMLACSQVTTAAAIPSTIPSSIPRTREERFSQVDGTTWNVGLPPRFIIRRSHAGRRSPSIPCGGAGRAVPELHSTGFATTCCARRGVVVLAQAATLIVFASVKKASAVTPARRKNMHKRGNAQNRRWIRSTARQGKGMAWQRRTARGMAWPLAHQQRASRRSWIDVHTCAHTRLRTNERTCVGIPPGPVPSGRRN